MSVMYGPSGAVAQAGRPGTSDPTYLRRRAMIQALQGQSAEYRPAYSWGEALARALTPMAYAVSGKWEDEKAQERDKRFATDYSGVAKQWQEAPNARQLAAMLAEHGNPDVSALAPQQLVEDAKMAREQALREEDRTWRANESATDRALRERLHMEDLAIRRQQMGQTAALAGRETYGDVMQVMGPDGKPMLVRLGSRGGAIDASTGQPVRGFQAPPPEPTRKNPIFQDMPVGDKVQRVASYDGGLTWQPFGDAYDRREPFIVTEQLNQETGHVERVAIPRAQVAEAMNRAGSAPPRGYPPPLPAPTTPPGSPQAAGLPPPQGVAAPEAPLQPAAPPQSLPPQMTLPPVAPPLSAPPQAASPSQMPLPQVAPPLSAPPQAAPPQVPPLATPRAAPPPPRQDGGVVLGPTGKPAFNEAQGKAAGFADRMAASHETLTNLESQGTDPIASAASAVPYVGNYLISPKRQMFEQAQRDFINAVLRRESGAVISDSEFDNARKQYFPQPGDSPEAIALKRRNREITLEGIRRDAGPGYRPGVNTGAGRPGLTPDEAPRAVPEGTVIVNPSTRERMIRRGGKWEPLK